MKILNLFAGIGGNRTLWGDEHEITAVEHDQKIAMIYHQRFPNDKVIIGDAYEYLEKHYQEFDFIWASPPCISHSRLVFIYTTKKIPDMRLYGLILFLQHIFHGKWIVENVNLYYVPLIPQIAIVGKHYIWANFRIPSRKKLVNSTHLHFGNIDSKLEEIMNLKRIRCNIDLEKKDLKQVINNTMIPEDGKYILDCALENRTLSKWF